MSNQLRIGELEYAINRYRRERPFHDLVLPLELRLMATLYGHMIHFRLLRVDLDAQPVPTQVVVSYWADLAVKETTEVA